MKWRMESAAFPVPVSIPSVVALPVQLVDHGRATTAMRMGRVHIDIA